jgi:hypothetical protein
MITSLGGHGPGIEEIEDENHVLGAPVAGRLTTMLILPGVTT